MWDDFPEVRCVLVIFSRAKASAIIFKALGKGIGTLYRLFRAKSTSTHEGGVGTLLALNRQYHVLNENRILYRYY